MTSSKHIPSVGIPLTLLAALANAAMATSAKLVSAQTPGSSLVLMRFFVSFILLLTFLPFRKRKKPLKKLLKVKRPWPYVVRISSAMGCLYAYFFALKRIPLSTAVVLMFTSPLFIPFITWIWKRVPIPKLIWWALATGFIGVVLVVGPQFGSFHSGLIAGIAAGILSAISFTASRMLTKTESPITINFYLFLVATTVAFTLGGTSFIRHLPSFTIQNWLLLIGVGFFGFFYQVFIIQAAKYTRIRYVGAFLYFTILFSFFAEWLLFHKSPSFLNYMGMLLIILGGILMALLDTSKAK